MVIQKQRKTLSKESGERRLNEKKILPVSVFLKVRSFHVEKSWQDMNENPSHPGSHCVRLWCSEMNI